MDETTPAGAGTSAPPVRFRMTIVTALSLGFGLLVFLAAAAVLGIGLWSARENTVTLLRERAELSIDLLVERLRGHLDPVVTANAYLARLITEGRIDPDDDKELAAALRAAVAATPQVVGMGFVTPDLRRRQLVRATGRYAVIEATPDMEEFIAERLRIGSVVKQPYWGDLIPTRQSRATLLNRRAPVHRDGKFIGELVSAVRLADLSRYLASTDDKAGEIHSFLLYGRAHVLAHRNMASGNFPRSALLPIPDLSEVNDPVLANIWNESVQRRGLGMHNGTMEHLLDLDDGTFAVIYRTITGYAGVPLLAGTYVRFSAGRFSAEMYRLIFAGAIGIGVVLLAILAALWLGRRIARPIRSLAMAADSVRTLEFTPAPTVAGSRLAELDEAARAFNTMTAGLRWFETYVPRSLVRRILGSNDRNAAIASAEREVTVLFTDIRGFTTLAETMSAAETAEFLNRHFSLLVEAVEAEDGTVDKYIGDSVMAFWGAPDPVVDHSARACRAALAIRRAVATQNSTRRTTGEPPLRMGIGIHCGRALVGNIGAAGRVNYTLVGDVVNSAQRIEQLSKSLEQADESVTILIGDEVAARVTDEFTAESCGMQRIRGREEGIEVFRLHGYREAPTQYAVREDADGAAISP